MKTLKFRSLLTILVFLVSFQAQATSVLQCATVLLTTPHEVPSEINKPTLFSLKHVRSLLGRYSDLRSWEPVQYSSDKQDSRSRNSDALLSRLNGIEADLFENSNVHARSYEIRGWKAVQTHLLRMRRTYDDIANSVTNVNAAAESLIYWSRFGAIVTTILTGLEITNGNPITATIAGTLGAGAGLAMYAGRRSKINNNRFRDFLTEIDETLGERNVFDRVLYFSNNVGMTEEALTVARHAFNIRDFATALRQDSYLIVLIDQMFYFDDQTQEPVLVNYYREWREPLPPPPKPPPKNNLKNEVPQFDWATGGLVPVPVRAPRHY
jgi:hypothetical protein